MDTQLKKGLLEICVLSLLRREDSYGYKIMGDLPPYAAVSESTLYPILKRLEAGGCLLTYTQAHNGRLRKYYRITPEGQQRIAEFIDQWREIEKIYHFIIEEDQTDGPREIF
ncbi:PadR family transcriptional regulator [Neobittarella massiliensis]|uniref:PadR family transcriptional regulator n=2 Tax=Oscillospiraceae TaxID=216572 RepID=A0A8J6IP94_9FIRM|nr:PadR family transcriptional regulator [Neobittarella massiliensis]MBC3515646.1 PadR family transcriptional regulator [Neobittarella massiliensis]SCJ50520.1 transcriptional regulator%2C Acidobacterial%2C PadR-family [uncultured Anaerotruncus sp.]